MLAKLKIELSVSVPSAGNCARTFVGLRLYLAGAPSGFSRRAAIQGQARLRGVRGGWLLRSAGCDDQQSRDEHKRSEAGQELHQAVGDGDLHRGFRSVTRSDQRRVGPSRRSAWQGIALRAWSVVGRRFCRGQPRRDRTETILQLEQDGLIRRNYNTVLATSVPSWVMNAIRSRNCV